MPSKRKKNNELQRTRRVAAAALRDCIVVYVSGNKVKHLFSLKHMQPVKPTVSIDRAVHQLRWRWTVYISVICETPDGEKYVKSEELAPSGEYLYSELADTLNEFHQELLQTVNINHNPRPAWIAAPRGTTFDEKTAADIYSVFE